jgi:hypothetical protein
LTALVYIENSLEDLLGKETQHKYKKYNMTLRGYI